MLNLGIEYHCFGNRFREAVHLGRLHEADIENSVLKFPVTTVQTHWALLDHPAGKRAFRTVHSVIAA